MNRAHGDDNWIERIIFAARNRLQRVNYFRREYNRILRLVRIGSVAAHATDSDIDRIDIRVCVTFGYANVAGFQVRLVMKTERKIRFTEFFVKTIFEQRARAAAGLLCRLRYKHDRPVPLIL